MELIEAGVQGVAIAELAGTLTDLRTGGGAAAGANNSMGASPSSATG